MIGKSPADTRQI